MKEFKGSLIERIKRTDKVESFRFRPEEKIEFLPGQFIQIMFDEGNKVNNDLNKYLSFSSAPEKDYIEVTKKLSDSEFSRRLKNLKQNDFVLFKGPLGNCVFKEEYDKIGFLIGGIGITPVISILEHIAIRHLSVDVCLLYSNWTKNDIAFKKELDSLREDNEGIKVSYTLVECKPEDTGCFLGSIHKEFLITHMSDYKKRVLFAFGPPGMVKAMKDICDDLEITKEMLKMENFMGY